jgi:hypothetical protein
VAILPDMEEEGAELSRCPHLQLSSVHLRRVGGVGHIANRVTPAHRVPEGPMHVGGLAELDDSGSESRACCWARRRRFWRAPPMVCLRIGVVSELWAVYSGRVALVLYGGWRAVRLLSRRPLVKALIEMAEQLALHRALRHGVVAAA